MNDMIRSRIDDLSDNIAEAVADVKPRLRGWLHAVNVPLTLAAGIVLIVLSPTASSRIGSSIYVASAMLLFTVSAIYHRGTWSPRVHGFLQRFDHANIFVLIAGTYTPFTIIMLEGTNRTIMLSVVWGGAVLGMLFRVFWIDAPRWLYTAIYLALGWAAVAFIGSFIDGGLKLGAGVGLAALILAAVGGGFYTLGGVVYGFKRPDPWPKWFGFHEVFHTFTILAFVSHYVGVSLATYSLR